MTLFFDLTPPPKASDPCPRMGKTTTKVDHGGKTTSSTSTTTTSAEEGSRNGGGKGETGPTNGNSTTTKVDHGGGAGGYGRSMSNRIPTPQNGHGFSPGGGGKILTDILEH